MTEFTFKRIHRFLKIPGFLLLVFIISTLPVFLGYTLKLIYPSEYGLIKGNKNDLEITYHEILFFCTVVFAFFVLSLSLVKVKNPLLKRALLIISLIYLFAAGLMVLLDCLHYLVFASRLQFSSVQTVLNSNSDEAGDFLRLYVTPLRLLPLLIFTFATVWLIRRRQRLILFFSAKPFLVVCFVFSIFGTVDFIQASHSKGNGLHNVRYWDVTIGEYNEYREFNRRLEREKTGAGLSEEYKAFSLPDTTAKTLVLVVSESLSRRHMSLYGYGRPTTPNLDSNRAIYRFTDCVTSAPLTTEAVPALFTNGYLENRVNLISLFNRLGYETTWLSNQAGWGRGDKSIVLFSGLCKNAVFTDGLGDDEAANTTLHHDQELLPHFRTALSRPAPRKLIVLHMMGCHFDYEKRYPSGRTVFSDQPPGQPGADNPRSISILNAYDNAMHYHDSVVGELIRIFQEQCADRHAAFVFLSDHGEELFDYRHHHGHGYPANQATAEIPFFMLVSPYFRQHAPHMDSIIRSRIHSPWSSKDAFFTLLQLQGVQSQRYARPLSERAFFSSGYNPQRVREVMGQDYNQMR